MGFTNDQLEAINHSGADLIISAAAGSGKTYTLTQRIIKKILNGVEAERAEREGRPREEIKKLRHGADISRMLIVTFTRPAASELKSEICSLISDELKKNPKSQHLISQYTNSSYADICTIDSFCMRLVRPNFDKLPVPIDASFRVGDTGELDILERQTMEELIDELYENSNESDDFLLVANCYSRIWSEEELARALLKLRKRLLSTKDGIKTLLDCQNYDNDFLSTPYGKVICEHILEITEHFIPIYKHYISLLAYDEIGAEEFVPTMKSELEYIKEIDASVRQKDSYDELSKKVNCFDFGDFSKKQSAKNKDIDISAFRVARANLAESIKSLKKLFVSSEAAVISSLKQNARVCKAIFNILKLFDDKLLVKKRLLSVYSFDDISKFALSLLYNEDGSTTKFADEIASRYDEIYIDEYQDTNSVQDRIFKAISINNRFMVGDIKQSIYRFRSAEPEIFKGYRESFSPKSSFNENSLGKAIFMSENFRCDKNVIELSNIVSNYMFENSNGIPYTKEDRLVYSKDLKKYFDKGIKSYNDVKSEIHIVNTKGQGKPSTPYIAEYVALQIKELIGKELPYGKKIEKKDITILLRNANKQIPIYVEALERHGISSVYKAEENFFEMPHIMLAICILNAIDNPSRDIYLAGAMRSEVFDFSLAELVKIKKRIKGTASLYSTLRAYDLNDELKEKIDKFLKRLSTLKREIKKKKAHDALSHIYTQCGLLTMCKSQERSDLMKLYNLARLYEGNTYKGVFSFLRHIDNISQDHSAKEFRGDSTKDSVQLMSIHASKGLQFPICFVCGLENTINTSDTKDDLLFHRDLGVAGYVGMDDGLARFDPLVRKCIALKLKKEANEEEMRILYVAMTRAENQLFLVGGTSNPKKAYKDATSLSDFTTPYDLYNANSHMKFILGALTKDPHPSYDFYCDVAVGDNKPLSGEFGPPNWQGKIDSYKETLKKRFNFSYKYSHLERIPAKLSVSNLKSNVLDTKNDDIKIPDLDSMPQFLLTENENSTGAQRGTATHVFLQFCDFKRLLDTGFDAELQLLEEKKFISKKDASLVNKEHIELFMKSDLIQQILNAKDVYREFRFNILLDANDFTQKKDLDNEKVLVQGVMDCVLITHNDKLILIDYKTDDVKEENCDYLLKRRYKEQLSYYEKACKLMFNKEVDEVKLYSVPLKREVIIKKRKDRE